MRKSFTISLIVLALLALLFIPARAFEITNESVIPAGQVINDDLFIAAEKVVIDGTINGNVFVNASEVTINGPVNGNLMVFGAITTVNAPVSGSVGFVGQTLELNSRVDGSVFAAGAAMVLNPQADVGLNIYFAGYSAQTMPGSRIGVDVSLSSYQAILKGEVTRNIEGNLSAFELDGAVGGDVQVDVDASDGQSFTLFLGPGSAELPDGIPSGIRVSDTASVGGTLTYTSPAEQSGAIALPGEKVVYIASVVEEKLTIAQSIQRRALQAGRDWITLLILGALLVRLLQRPLQHSSIAARQVLPALGWGIVVLLVTPLAVLLLGAAITIVSLLLGIVTLGGLSSMVSVGGYLALTLMALAFVITLLYISKLVVALAVGGWLYRRVWPQGDMKPIWPLLIGITVYELFAILPLGVGFLFTLLVSLIGLGAIWIMLRRRNLQPVPPAATPPGNPDEMSEVA
jgi:hypothetical protein